MTNLDSILKSRNIILPTTVYLVKAVVLPMYPNTGLQAPDGGLTLFSRVLGVGFQSRAQKKKKRKLCHITK